MGLVFALQAIMFVRADKVVGSHNGPMLYDVRIHFGTQLKGLRLQRAWCQHDDYALPRDETMYV